MFAAQDLILDQCELLAGGQLPIARVAREARQMEYVLFGPSNPVGRCDFSPALGALCESAVKRIARAAISLRWCG